MVNDPVADFITRIKNASMSHKEVVSIPYSKMKMDIAELMKKKGYISGIDKRGRKVKKFIDLKLIYKDGQPRLSGVKRVSKPSRRLYIGAKDIRPVKQGLGLLVLSTPNGIISGDDARKKNVGGEILFEIW